MQDDDIIIGAGLTGLATAMGLLSAGGARRVRVIGGPQDGETRTYTTGGGTPAAHVGMGGLGQFWHGVIPLSARHRLGASDAVFARVMEQFYPRLDQSGLGQDKLLVPWRPIRPKAAFQALAEAHDGLTLDTRLVTQARSDGTVVLNDGTELAGARIWLAAGTLGTPELVESLLEEPVRDRKVSDHVIGYLGQITSDDPAVAALRRLHRERDGLVIPAYYSADGRVLYTLRPARFDFARLDEGFEKRAVFGLPTSRAVAGIAGKLSPGLVAEALFNKVGIGARSRIYSVYYQTVAKDAYGVDPAGNLSAPDLTAIRAAADHARSEHPFDDLTLSKAPDLFLPGVHLHGSVTSEERSALNSLERVTLVDPSGIDDLGPEHHSFKLMALAFDLAQRT